MQRTATYWPPDSWKSAAPGQNVAVHVQAIWTKNGTDVEVYLGSDVAEGGYLYDGISRETDPTMQEGASKIALFLSHPDLRLLKQIRKAILS